ncbi:MAG: MFS transporter, partial [Proteobacteria bacterium]|nr:MFS transporter [Pseudomonadota bacterium]
MPRNYGWIVVAAGALMTCVGMGSMFSLAVFLQPISDATGWSRTGISSAMTIDFLVMGVAGFFWGALSDRFGTRLVVLCGAVLLGAGLVLASQATSLDQFRFIYGLMVGLAAGSFVAPMIALASSWFSTRRALAVSLVSAGMGVAPMTVSPFARWLITTYDWRTAQMTIGIAAWILLIPAALLVRRAPPVDATAAGGIAEPPRMTAAQALRSRPFIVLSATFFACCATHSGPIFHTVSYALACGIPAMAAVTIYSVEGLSGLGGRLVLGLAGDRFGAKPVLIAGLLVQSFAAAAYYVVRDIGEFYAVAIVFGMAYGGTMPLYAVLARGYFGPHIMGTVFGAAAMISSLGMALGPPLGGWIFDTFGSYGGLYLSSWAFGLGAVAIALFFPPLPSASVRRLQPA